MTHIPEAALAFVTRARSQWICEAFGRVMLGKLDKQLVIVAPTLLQATQNLRRVIRVV